MTTNQFRGADWRQIVLITVGLFLFVGGAIVLVIDPAWTESPVGAGAAIITGGLTLIITTIARRRHEQRDEVVADERLTSINEKSGNRAFQAAFAAQGILFAVVSLTTVKPPLTTVLGGLFVFTAFGYLGAYSYYRRLM